MLGEPGTSEGKWQPSGGLTQPAEDRGRAGVGTPSSVSSPGAERRCAVALSVLGRVSFRRPQWMPAHHPTATALSSPESSPVCLLELVHSAQEHVA